MREYSTITPAFWIGETGKKLRGDANAQLLAMYLMTSPHSTMTGVFHCPVLYMSYETGIPIEGALKALARLINEGFCEFDEASDTVFVVKMAAYQIAPILKPGDNRIVGLRKEMEKTPPSLMKSRFIATYSEAFCLNSNGKDSPKSDAKTSPSEAPPKPGTGTGTGTGDKTPSSAAKLPTCPFEVVVSAYNQILPEMAGVKVIDEDRKRSIKKRWDWVLSSKKPDGSRRAETGDEAIEWFKKYFEVARENDFLMGRTPKSGDHQNWKCDIEFLMSSKGIKQVIEKTEVAQ